MPQPHEPPWPALLGLLAFVALLNGFAVYQLFSGRASCWPWQTRSAGTRWWLFRDEQPVAYWFRVVLWFVPCLVIDGLIALAVLGKPV